MDMTKHDPGMLCWADLMAADHEKAKKFYGDLFGWKLADRPIPDGGIYTMALLREKAVAGMAPMMEDLKKQSIPTHWSAYIAVKSAEETVKKVEPAGGKVLDEPFDVMGKGIMAVIQDPTGAVLHLWQPLESIGAYVMGEPGSLCWAELMTSDTRKAGDFYRKVLGWNRNEMPEMAYTVLAVGEKGAVGMMAIPKEAAGMPSRWHVYFAVADCDDTIAKTIQLGGKVLLPAKEAKDVGRFAVLQDSQGAAFCILQPARE